MAGKCKDPVTTAPGSVPTQANGLRYEPPPQLSPMTRGKLSRVEILNSRGAIKCMSAEELKELLGTLAATPANIQSLLNNTSDEQLRRRHSVGGFSFAENVCHLRDIEAEGYATRIKRILKEERPFLPDIDGGRLATEREYNKQDVYEALHAFAQARIENTRALNDLGPEELSRAGTLEGVGDVKLEELLVMMRDHDAAHLKDIEQTISLESESLESRAGSGGSGILKLAS